MFLARRRFSRAIRRSNISTVQSLLRKIPSLATTADGWTRSPVLETDVDIACMIIDAGGDPTCFANMLSRVAAAGQTALTIRLLSRHVPIEEHLLHLAAANGQFEIATALLSHGAEVEKCDSKGLTPLFRAMEANIYRSSPKTQATVDLLKKHGASLSEGQSARLDELQEEFLGREKCFKMRIHTWDYENIGYEGYRYNYGIGGKITKVFVYCKYCRTLKR